MSDPKIEQRAQLRYMGINSVVPWQQLPSVIPQQIGEIFAWLGQHGIAPAGPPFVRYNVIDMEHELDIDIGIPVGPTNGVAGDERVQSKSMPAGRYATLLHIGPYDQLRAANARLIEWAEAQHLDWDRRDDPKGESFAGRYESYLSEPDEKPERTEVGIKLAD